MKNTIIVEDNKYMAKYLIDMLSADERFHLVSALPDAFEAERL